MTTPVDKARTETRRVGSNVVSVVVDRLGGWPERLPDGGRTRVAFRCRGFGRGYETEVVHAFLSVTKPGSLVLDVGAHWGVYTLLAARRGAEVIAFEPNPQNRGLLKRNLLLSGLRADVRPVAIANTDGEITFHSYEGSSWGRSMMGGLAPQEFTRPLTVPAARLDSLALSPDVIKLDVEGAEGQALTGAADTIARFLPTIFVEVHLDRLVSFGFDAGTLEANIRQWGYEIHEVLSTLQGGAERISHWMCVPARAR